MKKIVITSLFLLFLCAAAPAQKKIEAGQRVSGNELPTQIGGQLKENSEKINESLPLPNNVAPGVKIPLDSTTDSVLKQIDSDTRSISPVTPIDKPKAKSKKRVSN